MSNEENKVDALEIARYFHKLDVEREQREKLNPPPKRSPVVEEAHIIEMVRYLRSQDN